MTMPTILRNPMLLITTLCALSGACDAPGDVDDPPEITDVDGLTLKTWENRVEGSFTRGEATIEFVLERDGDLRSAELRASDGSPLLESVVADGQETVTLFGGRAVLSGLAGAPEPDVEGDPAAQGELMAMPEAACIGQLHAALAEAGVDPVLLGAEPTDDEVVPRLYNDGKYWNMAPYESILVGTWGWLTYTHIAVRWDYVPPNLPPGPAYGAGAVPLPWIPTACARFKAGLGGWANICTAINTETIQAYQFWGALLTVQNIDPSVTLKVRTY